MGKSVSRFQWRGTELLLFAESFFLWGNMEKLSSSIRVSRLRAKEFRESWNWIFYESEDRPGIAKLGSILKVSNCQLNLPKLAKDPAEPFLSISFFFSGVRIQSQTLIYFLTRRFARTHTSKDQEFIKRIDFTYGYEIRLRLEEIFCWPRSRFLRAEETSILCWKKL